MKAASGLSLACHEDDPIVHEHNDMGLPECVCMAAIFIQLHLFESYPQPFWDALSPSIKWLFLNNLGGACLGMKRDVHISSGQEIYIQYYSCVNNTES